MPQRPHAWYRQARTLLQVIAPSFKLTGAPRLWCCHFNRGLCSHRGRKGEDHYKLPPKGNRGHSFHSGTIGPNLPLALAKEVEDVSPCTQNTTRQLALEVPTTQILPFKDCISGSNWEKQGGMSNLKISIQLYFLRIKSSLPTQPVVHSSNLNQTNA